MGFAEIWERVQEKTDLSTISGLGAFVGSSQQHASRKKKQNIFPVEWAYKIAQEYNLSTDWLMTGKGKVAGSNNISKFKTINELDKWLIELCEKDPEEEIWFRKEIEKKLPDFKKWKTKEFPQESETFDLPYKNVA